MGGRQIEEEIRKAGKLRVYLASSWRNKEQEIVLDYIRNMGIDVYDFKKPENAFHWSEIDENWRLWTSEQMEEALNHPLAARGYVSDFSELAKCDALVLLLPCGISAHLEAGYAIGKGRPVFILSPSGAPELMYKMAAKPFCHTLTHLHSQLKILIEVHNAR